MGEKEGGDSVEQGKGGRGKNSWGGDMAIDISFWNDITCNKLFPSVPNTIPGCSYILQKSG